jgi:uncharacterized FAD-dependent dehydrogenase
MLSNIGDFNLIKDRLPSASMQKKLSKAGYEVSLNDYTQLIPKDIHALSKYMAGPLENAKNINFNFDAEVFSIRKQKNIFIVMTSEGEFKSKKIIIAAGRAGWRWASNLYSNLGIIDSNDIARYGIRVEMNAEYLLKDFNKSACSISRDDVEIGPLNWYGSVVPEDHLDMAISVFRSNEARWKSAKVSFNIIGNIPSLNNGYQQTDRLAQLTFVLTNERIIREKVSRILAGTSKISILPDYDWLKVYLKELSITIPEITVRGYFHSPTITPMIPKINVGKNLSTEIDGLFVCGENCGISGILSAALTGLIVAKEVCK